MACRATRNLSCEDEISAKLVSEGICEGLIEVLKLHVENDAVIEVIKLEGSTNIVLAVLQITNIRVTGQAALWAIVNLVCNSDISTIFGVRTFISLYFCDSIATFHCIFVII